MTTPRTVILSFENRHYNAIGVYWIDQEEKNPQRATKLQRTLDPGESYLQESTQNDNWLVSDQVSGKLLLRYQAKKDEELVIRGEQRRLPVKGSTLDLISAAYRPTEPDRNFALDFDGENDVVIVPHQDDLHLGPEEDGYEWTLESWVYRATEDTEHPILEKSDAETGGYSLRVGENGRIQAGLMNGSSFLYGEGSTPLQARQWYHLAATFNGKTLFKYTDEFEFLWTNPSNRYLRNVVFYRPVPPPGYVRLGDLCEPGLPDPETKNESAPHYFRLARRVLVARDPALTPGLPVLDENGEPFPQGDGTNWDPWANGIRRADTVGAAPLWESQADDASDPDQRISVWKPALADPNLATEYQALGYILHLGSGAPDLTKDESSYYLVHNNLLTTQPAPAKLETQAEWENDVLEGIAMGNEGPLRIWSVLGSGFFTADTLDVGEADPSIGDVHTVHAEILEQIYSQFQTYINGQPEPTIIRMGRDVKSNRTTLDLNGEDEYVQLPELQNLAFSQGMTFEAWAYFRHDNPIWRASEAARAPIAGEDDFPILHLQERSKADDNLVTAEEQLNQTKTNIVDFVADLQNAAATALEETNTLHDTVVDERDAALQARDDASTEKDDAQTALDEAEQKVSDIQEALNPPEPDADSGDTTPSTEEEQIDTEQGEDEENEEDDPTEASEEEGPAFTEEDLAEAEAAVTVASDALTAAEAVLAAAVNVLAAAENAVTAAEKAVEAATTYNDAALAIPAIAEHLTTDEHTEAQRDALESAALHVAALQRVSVKVLDAKRATETARAAVTTLKGENLGEGESLTEDDTTQALGVAETAAETATTAAEEAATAATLIEPADLQATLTEVTNAATAARTAFGDSTSDLASAANKAATAAEALVPLLTDLQAFLAAEDVVEGTNSDRRGLLLSYDADQNELTLTFEGEEDAQLTIPGFLAQEEQTDHVVPFATKVIHEAYLACAQVAAIGTELNDLEAAALAAKERSVEMLEQLNLVYDLQEQLRLEAAQLVKDTNKIATLNGELSSTVSQVATKAQGTHSDTLAFAQLACSKLFAAAPAGPITNMAEAANNLAQALTATSDAAAIQDLRSAAGQTAIEAYQAVLSKDAPANAKETRSLAKAVEKACIALVTSEQANRIVTGIVANNEDLRTAEAVVFRRASELNAWVHLAITIATNGQVFVHKNGRYYRAAQDSFTIAQGAVDNILLNDIRWGNNQLGRSQTAAPDHFNGYLAEVRLWGRLQDEELREVFENQAPATTDERQALIRQHPTRIFTYHDREIGNLPGLLAYWPLNEGPQRGRILDYSDNGLHIQQLREIHSLQAATTNTQTPIDGQFTAPAQDDLNLTLQLHVENGVTYPSKTKGHLSLELWFRLDSDFTGNRLSLLRHADDWSLEIVKEGDRQRIVFFYKANGAGDWVLAAQDIDQIQQFIGKGWTHLFLVYNADPKVHDDGKQAPHIDGLYIDGQFISLENTSDRLPTARPRAGQSQLNVGPGPGAATNLHLAEIRLWGTLLPPMASIHKRFYQLRPHEIEEEKLLAYWPLNGSGDTPTSNRNRTKLTWTADATDPMFKAHDLALHPADWSPKKWNTRSHLRLLPFSIVPRTTLAPLKMGALEQQNSLTRLGLIKNTHFEGMIDSVRVWNTARSATEIKSVWNQKLDGDAPTGLIRYYRFDEGIGEYARHYFNLETAPVDDPNNGKFGGDNAIRNLRMWTKALTIEELRDNMNSDDSGNVFPYEDSQDDRLIEHPTITLVDEEGEPLLDGEEEVITEIEAPGQDEAILRRGTTDTSTFHLDQNRDGRQDFTIELEVKVDSFILSGKEHYLVFKQDAWALMLYKQDGELYFAFTYDYKKNIQQGDWKLVVMDKPVTRRGWVYVAIVGDTSARKLFFYQDRIDYNTHVLDTPQEADLLELKRNSLPMLLGEEGKPKWSVSDLLLMDGLEFDGLDDQIKLPRIVADFSRGFTAESWIFIDPVADVPDPAPLPILDLAHHVDTASGDAINQDNIILAVQPARTGALHSLQLVVYNDTDKRVVATPAVFPEGEWIHVAATIDKSHSVAIYQNGELVSGLTPESADTVRLPRNITREEGFAFIGRSNPGSLTPGQAIHHFKGKLDEIRLWNRPRPARLLKGYMRRELPEVHEHLVAMWRFGEGSGIAAFDSTANGFHGLLGDGTNDALQPEWVVVSEKINAGLQFNGQGFVRIQEPEVLVPSANEGDPLVTTRPFLWDAVEDRQVLPESGFTLETWIKPQHKADTAEAKIIAFYDEENTSSFLISYTVVQDRLQFIVQLADGTISRAITTYIHSDNIQQLDATQRDNLATNNAEDKVGLLVRDPNSSDYFAWDEDNQQFVTIDEQRLVEFNRWFHLAVILQEKTGDSSQTELAFVLHTENRSAAIREQAATISQPLPDLADVQKIELGETYTGALDELRLWNYARQTEQIKANLFTKVDPFDRDTPVVAFDSTTEAIQLETDRNISGSAERAAEEARLMDIQRLRIPPGRTVAITWKKEEQRVVRVFDESTPDGQDIFHDPEGNVFVVLPAESADPLNLEEADTPQTISGTVIQNDAGYQIEQITLGYAQNGGLLGYWPMNENTGQEIQDKTSFRHRGRFVTLNEEDKIPQWIETSDIQYDGFQFDGYSEFVEIPFHEQLNPTIDFSLSAWIEPNRFHGLQGIVTKVTDIDNSQFALSMESEMLRFDYEHKGNNYSLVGGQIKDGWNHVAVTVKSRLIEINELLGSQEALQAKAEAFTRAGQTTGEDGFPLDGAIRVAPSDTLASIRSLQLPITRTAILTWKRKPTNQLQDPQTGYLPHYLYQNYDESVDDIYSAFPETPGRYETSREAVLANYTLEYIHIRLRARRHKIKLPKIHLYVNGLLVHSGIAPKETLQSSFNINIGAWGGNVRDYFFHGTIDSVALWNKALTQDEILRTKDDPNAAQHPNVVGFWRPNPSTIQLGVTNLKNPAIGRGLFGQYAKDGTLYRFEPAAAQDFQPVVSDEARQGQITFPGPIGLNRGAITIEYWFKGDRLGHIFSQEEGSGNQMRYIRSGLRRENPEKAGHFLPTHAFSNDDAIRLDPTVVIDPKWNAEDGAWHHIAVVWEQDRPGGYAAYLDGNLIERGDTSNRPLPFMNAAAHIGPRLTVARSSDRMQGTVAEVRIWSIARMQQEIRRTQKRRLLGTEPGLIHYWRLDDAVTQIDGNNQVVDHVEELTMTVDADSNKSIGNPAGSVQKIEGEANQTKRQANSGLYLLNKLEGITLNALTFDGENDYVYVDRVPGIRLNNDFTFEAWVQLPQPGPDEVNQQNGGPIFSRMVLEEDERGRRPSWKCLFIKDNVLSLGQLNEFRRYEEWGSIPYPTDGEWHHIAIRYDRSALKLWYFLDGEEKNLVNLSSMFRDRDPRRRNRGPAIRNLAIGVGRTGNTPDEDLEYFRGNIGEVRIWNEVRSSARLKNNYQTALKGNEIGLEGLWRFTEGEGLQVPNEVPEDLALADVYGASWISDSGFKLFGLEEAEAAVVVTEDGKVFENKCLHLTGGTDRVDLGNPTHLQLTGTMTVEAWVYLDALSAHPQAIISKGAGGEFELAMVNNKLNYYHGGNYRQEYDFEFEAERWYHIALVRENGIKLLRTYVNGNITAARVFDSIQGGVEGRRAEESDKLYTNRPPLPSGSSLTIGNAPTQNRGLAGRIKDVRIWNQPRRQSQIEFFKGRQLRGDEIGLIAYLPFATDPNELDKGDTKTITIQAKVKRDFALTDFASSAITFSGWRPQEDGDDQQLVTVNDGTVAVNDPLLIPDDDRRSRLVSYQLKVKSNEQTNNNSNFVQLQMRDNLMGRLNNQLIQLTNIAGDFVLNPRYGSQSNSLMDRQPKQLTIIVEMTTELPADTSTLRARLRNQIWNNTKVTGIDRYGYTADVRSFQIAINGITGNQLSYTIRFHRGRRYRQIQIEHSFNGMFTPQTFRNRVSISGDFVINPAFTGELMSGGQSDLLWNDPAYESDLLALPDYSRFENHGVRHGGRIAEVMEGQNELAPGKYGAVKIRVRLTSTQLPGSFKNAIAASAQKLSTKEKVEVSLEQNMTTAQFPDPQDGGAPMIEARQSELVAPTGQFEQIDGVTTIKNPYEAIYAIVVRNISADENFINVQVQEDLEAIFQEEGLKDFVDQWELVSVENTENPAQLLPPFDEDLVSDLAPSDLNDLTFNPLFDGKDYTELLGLALKRPRRVASPPVNLARVARNRRIRAALARQRRRPNEQLLTGPGHHVPGISPTAGLPAQPDTTSVAPQPTIVTSVDPEPLIQSSPFGTGQGQVEESSPEGGVLQELRNASPGGQLQLTETLLTDIGTPASVRDVFEWLTPTETNTSTDFSLRISGPGEGIEIIRDNGSVKGFRITGTMTILNTDCLLTFKLLKNDNNQWDYTFLFNLKDDFDLMQLRIGAQVPRLNGDGSAPASFSLSSQALDDAEETHLAQLEGDGVGSIAKVEEYVQQVANQLRQISISDDDYNQFTEDTELKNRLKAVVDAATAEALDQDQLLIDLEAEVANIQDPYPSLHTHQRQPIKQALTTLSDFAGRSNPSDRLRKNSYLALLIHLLHEQESRQAEYVELNTRKLLPLGFAISNVGEENSKISRGLSISGGVAVDSLGELNVVETTTAVGFFVNANPGHDGSNGQPAVPQQFMAEVGIEADLRQATNPVYSLAHDIFGLQHLQVYAYAVTTDLTSAPDLVGIKAAARVQTNTSETLNIVRSIFGVNEIFLSVEGSKAAGQEAELLIEGRTAIDLAKTSNPLLKVTHQLLGLNTIELVLAASRGGGGNGVSMIATGLMNLADAETDLADFMLDFFGMDDVSVLFTVEVAKAGGATSLGVKADIIVELGEDPENPFFGLLNDIFGIERIVVSIEIDQDAFNLRIDLGIDKEIEVVHRLMQVYVETLIEYRPPSSTIRLGAALQLDTGSGIIILAGSLGAKVSPGAAVVEGTLGMKGQWENPFGIQGIALYTVIIELGLTGNAPWLSKLGIAAAMRVGRSELEIAAKVDLADPTKNGFVGKVSNLNMMDVVNTLTGPHNKIPRSLTKVISGMHLNHFQLSVIPHPPLTIGVPPVQVEYFDEGVTAICDLNFWGFEAYSFLQVNYTDGLTAFASFSTMDIIPGILKIEADPSLSPAERPALPAAFVSKGGPEMYVKLNPSATPEVYIQGKVTILNVLSRSLAIKIDGNRLWFRTTASLFDLFMLSLEVDVATDFSSMYFKAEMQNDFFAKVREMAVGRINELRDAALGDLDDAQVEVDKLDDQIEARRRVLQAQIDAVTRELDDAKNTIRRERRKVNGIQRKIDKLDKDYDDLSWGRQILEAIPYGIQKGALEAAKGIANAALWVAEQFLEGLKWTINFLPIIELDPIIIGLNIAKGVATAALEIAKVAVKGFAAISTGLVQLALGEFFDIRYAMFEANYSSGFNGEFYVHMKATIVFLGNVIDIDFYIDLKALENGVKGLVEKLMDDL